MALARKSMRDGTFYKTKIDTSNLIHQFLWLWPG